MSHENPAEAGLLPEPRRPARRRDAVRAETDGLHDAADGAGLHQLAGSHRRTILEPLAVHDRVDALRLSLHTAHLGELLERRDARLVGHVVLAVLHDADAEGRAIDRNRRAQDELNARILQDLVLAPRELRLREPRLKVLRQVGFRRIQPDEFASAAQDGADLAVDVAVVDADDGKPNPRPGTLRRSLGRSQRGRPRHALHEGAPIDSSHRHGVTPHPGSHRQSEPRAQSKGNRLR